MKIKLDENLGSSIAKVFVKAGYQATTIREEELCGSSDHEVIEVCRREKKVLLTLDLGFGNPLLFPPSLYPGIIVMRPGRKVHLPDLIDTAKTVIEGLSQRTITGKLWVVNKNRIREHRETNEEK